MTTEDEAHLKLGEKCVLIKGLPPGTSDIDLIELFPSAIQVSLAQEIEEAVVLFVTSEEADQQLHSSFRFWKDTDKTIEIIPCPPGLVPAEWKSLSVLDLDITSSLHSCHSVSLLSPHSYPEGDDHKENGRDDELNYLHVAHPSAEGRDKSPETTLTENQIDDRYFVAGDNPLTEETRYGPPSYNQISTPLSDLYSFQDDQSQETSAPVGNRKHYPKYENYPLTQEDQSVRQVDNSVWQEDNSVRQADNSVWQEDNSVRQADNSVWQEDNSVRQADNSVWQEDNSVRQADNSVWQEDNSVRQVDNSVWQEDNSVRQADNSVWQEDNSVRQVDISVWQEDNSVRQADNSVWQEDNSVRQADNSVWQEDNSVRQADNSVWQEDNSPRREDTVLKTHTLFGSDGVSTGEYLRAGVEFPPPYQSPPPSYIEAMADSKGDTRERPTPQAVLEDQERQLKKFSPGMEEDSGMECQCIEVTGLPVGVEEEELELYFSNKRRSGGGEVQNVTLNKSQNSAIIKFTQAKAVDIVLQKCPLLMREKKISVDRYFESQKPTERIHLDDAKVEPCVVKVTGVPADLHPDHLELYFENEKKSGGGDMKKIEHRPNGSVLITFADSEVAERVLSHPAHEIKKTKITVSRYKKPAQKTICVTGFKPPVSREMLELFFENEKKSGGGEIKSIEMIEDSTALVNFEEEAVCLRVSRRKQLELVKQPLCVSLWEEEDDVVEDDQRTVQVTGIPPDAYDDMILLLFNHEKKSGGGEIEAMTRDEKSTALITFKFKEVAQRVIEHAKSRQIQLSEKKLSVSPWTPKSKRHPIASSKQVQVVDTIQVTGNIDKISSEMLSLYFENPKRSGGGEISDESHDENGGLLIKFVDPKVVSSVLSKGTHKVEGERLHVAAYNPPPRTPIDPNMVFIEGVRAETTFECLNMYIENMCGYEPKKVVPGERPGTFMLMFQESPPVDLVKFQKACKKKALEGSYLTVSAVPVSNCIRVANISSTTSKDALQFYFENKKKSGGGPVSDVQLFKEEGYAVVHFTNHEDVTKVVGRGHRLEKCNLSLTVHYDFLGLVSLDGTEMPLILPEPANIPIQEYVMHFFLHSPVNQRAFEEQMSLYSAKVDWHKGKGNLLIISCMLSKSENNRSKLATWKDAVNKAVKDFLGMFKVEEISCLQETWPAIKDGLKSGEFDLKEGGLVIPDNSTKTVVVVGHLGIVDKGKVSVEKLNRAIEAEMEHQKKVIKEVKKLEHFQLLFLKIHKLSERMEAKFPHMKIKLNFQENSIEFNGLPSDIANAKVAMYEEFQMIKDTSVDLSPCICDLLESSAPVKKFIANQFREKGLKAVWSVKESCVTVHATTDKDIIEGVQLIKNRLVDGIVRIKPESTPLLSSGKWQETVARLESNYQGMLNVVPAADKTQVNIVTTSEIIPGAMEVINDFIKANTILNELTQLDSGRAHFICKYKMSEIKSLEKSLQQQTVSIKINRKPDSAGMQVKGTEMGIQQAKFKLEEIMGKISTRRYHVQKPGFPKYLRSEKGKDFLIAVETQFQVIIRESSEQDSSGVEEDFVVVDKPGLKGPQVRASVTLAQNRKVFVVKGDMTSYKVDAMVNAANGQLKHGGGLAGAIVSKGGRSIQEESDAYVRKYGALLEGNVAVTSAGALPCKAIIHAVGPVWKGGASREEEHLDEAVFESIEAASKMNLQTIAIPALSTGIYGYPLTHAVGVIVEAVESYFKEEPGSSVQEVHLIDVSETTVNKFVTALGTKFGRNNVKEFGGNHPVPAKRKWKTATIELPSPSKDISSDEVRTRAGLQIRLVKGELAKQKADVLVNSTGKELVLKNGAVSRSLLNAAGAEMQKEANARYPNGCQTAGEICATKGYKLNCKEVYHTALPAWKADSSKPTQGLEGFIAKCLKKASDSGYSVISFPALGSGNLAYPEAAVAKTMYETVVKFSDSTQNSSLKTVTFVVFPGNPSTVKAFEDEKIKLGGQPHNPGAAGRRRNRHFGGASGAKGKTSPAGPVQEEEIFPLQNINFIVSHGDITRVSTDAIVNSTNDQLQLSRGAISGAILRAAGSQIQDECETLVKDMKKKGIVISGAGNLKCKNIIHIDAQDKHSWKNKMVMCLNAANDKGASTLAFPAVGTGVGKQDPKKIAENMFNAINEFQSSSGSSADMHIKEVRLVVFDAAMVSSIKSGLRECFSKAGAAPKSWWRKLVSGISGVAGFLMGEGDNRGSGENTKSPKEVALVIISDKTEAIDGSIQKIDAVLKEEFQDTTIEGEWSESIKKLTDDHIAEIWSCENIHDVQLKVEKRVGRIRLQGLPSDVMAAFQKITGILRDSDRMINEAEASELVTSIVQWCFLESDPQNPTVMSPPVKYDKTMNMKLEKAFLAKETKLIVADDNGDKYCYDFNAMEEYPEDDPTDKVKLIRKEVNAQGTRFEQPATWSEMNNQDLLVVQLQSSDSEYQSVVSNLKGQISNIIKIERIQNRSLYEQYLAKKGKIEKVNQSTNVERTLWHGTSSDTIPSINNYGFNRSYCGKNATAFGNGVYFAVNAQYSASNTYSRPDSSGHKRMYQTKVLVGEYINGRSGMIVPPAKRGHILYDSVVDNPGSPSLFVIFHDAQAYPEYLITFQ